MLDELKQSLKKTQDHLDTMLEKMEDTAEDWSDEAKELWQDTRKHLQQFKASLVSASESLHTQTDEARLQAHLAAMDASDQWQHLNKVVSDFSHHAANKTTQELQHANLQAHLAAMETRDFIDQKAPQIKREFSNAKEKVESASMDAVKSLEKSLEKMGDLWSKVPY